MGVAGGSGTACCSASEFVADFGALFTTCRLTCHDRRRLRSGAGERCNVTSTTYTFGLTPSDPRARRRPRRGGRRPAGAARGVRQRRPDDARLDQGVHGAARDRDPPRAPPTRRPTRRTSRACSATSSTTGRTCALCDPADLARELDAVRDQYNNVRLHAGIGYVAPDDEHHGRDPARPPAGLERACGAPIGARRHLSSSWRHDRIPASGASSAAASARLSARSHRSRHGSSTINHTTPTDP